ncbi:MAG: EAL domain-containing protein, partial [Oscillospiraceae bacterium]|nr:EAL domain-containing protein [Oscillospiraceae bacterium]
MIHVLEAVYIIQIIVLCICIGKINKDDTGKHQSMLWLVVAAVVTAVGYTASILIPAEYTTFAVFATGLYFVCTDWLAIALVFFVADYTRVHKSLKPLKLIFAALAGVDSVSLLANTFTLHLFNLERWLEYWKIQYNPLHYIHLFFVYFMVACSAALLLYRMVKAPKIYKSKYGTILFLLSAVIIINLICVKLGFRYDFSVLLYGILATLICYFVLHASPMNLMESMNSTLVEDSVIGLFVYDDDKKCVAVNQAAKDLFGIYDNGIYKAAEEYLAKWEEEFQGKMADSMGAERQIIKDGEELHIYVNYQKLLDEKGRVIGSGFQFEDRTEVVKQHQEDKYNAAHDALTGLLNRDAFEKRVKEILAGSDETYYMMCSNIKDFKLINELCGSAVGDQLLITQANVIRTDESGDSASCRMYADKFCTLLPKRDYNEEGFGKNMSHVMDSVLSIPLKTQFYFGIYEIVDRTESVWTMCDKAMMAIDAISGSYEKSFNFFKEELFQRIIKEKEIIGEFDKAIENDEFHMFLQPQIANDGTLVGAEALVRWIHPVKGMVSPADFIPVLEKSGLIHKLDLVMWEKAAQQLEKWRKAGREDLSISVNISTKDFYLTDISEEFSKIAKKYDFDIRNLKLEITESALMKDVRKIMHEMDELHELGYDIEIDDFGS